MSINKDRNKDGEKRKRTAGDYRRYRRKPAAKKQQDKQQDRQDVKTAVSKSNASRAAYDSADDFDDFHEYEGAECQQSKKTSKNRRPDGRKKSDGSTAETKGISRKLERKFKNKNSDRTAADRQDADKHSTGGRNASGRDKKDRKHIELKPFADRESRETNERGNRYAPVNFSNERISRDAFSADRRLSGRKIRIIPLGGLEQIGMNITVIESDDSIVIVDCGMAFPDEEMLGIDLVIPDITYLREHEDKIEGFFITHGHEDHIGALPYVLKNLNVPVYSTRLTRALIENKLREHGLIESAKLNTVQFGDFVEAGDFTVEFIKTNHSIQDAAALAIHSPAGVVLHTGDFKVDYTPVFGDTIDLQRFAELGRQGVLALLCDSTNAVRQGFTMSERTVGHTFENIFAENRDKRIIVATFASNVDRVQQIINVAEKYGRKVVIDGRSMVNVISTASELGYIKMNDNTLIDISEIGNYPDDKIVLIVTGSQGEPMAVLSRMATGQHKKLSLSANDVIVLSSTPIPGNEKAVSKVINELSRRRSKVIYQDTHVSGHACAEELKLIYTLVHPRFSIPVHGELRHRLAQKEVALAIGMPKENCFLVDTGDVVELSMDSCRVIDKVQAGPILVDGLGIGDVGNAVLKDRQSMSQNGIIVAVVSVDRSTGDPIADPEILTRGLVYVKENEEIIYEARDVVLRALDSCRGNRDLARVRNVIRNELSDYIWKKIHRTPMILTVITEV